MKQGAINEYVKCTIIDMSNGHIAIKYCLIREGVGAAMGGKILEYEAKAIRKEGVEQGIKQGIEGTVFILKNLGIPTQTILAKIQEQYSLSPEDSAKYL